VRAGRPKQRLDFAEMREDQLLLLHCLAVVVRAAVLNPRGR
jgi:hypothetical protein